MPRRTSLRSCTQPGPPAPGKATSASLWLSKEVLTRLAVLTQSGTKPGKQGTGRWEPQAGGGEWGAVWNAKLAREDRRGQALRSETLSARSDVDCARVASREKRGDTVGPTARDISRFSHRKGAGSGTENAALCTTGTQLTRVTSDLISRSLSIHPVPREPGRHLRTVSASGVQAGRLSCPVSSPFPGSRPPRWPQELSPSRQLSQAPPGPGARMPSAQVRSR